MFGTIAYRCNHCGNMTISRGVDISNISTTLCPRCGKEMTYRIMENSMPNSQPVVVKCPYCQSTNTSKISSFEKTTSTLLFGIFSQKRKYQWHCNTCNSDF